MVGLKKLLMGLMLFGAVTYFGGGGTFASFSAETSNAGSSISSGTLTMNDTVNNGGACMTANAPSANNFNAACTAALALSNVAPGVAAGTATITIQNTGSIDASKLSAWASPINATLSTGILSGASPVTSLAVSSLEGPVFIGDPLVLSHGTDSQTFLATAAAAGSSTATTISVQASPPGVATANAAYPIGSTVTDTNGNTVGLPTSANNTNCYDRQTTVAGAAGVGITKGTDLNFNPTVGNPFCSRALIFLQETTGTFNYCWLGNGSNAANGLCTVPIVGVTLGSALTASPAITSIPIGIGTVLNGNVSSGDLIVVTGGGHTQTFTVSASGSMPIGTTTSSIAVNLLAPGFAFPIGSTVVDSTAANAVNADQTNTITNFDTAHHSTGAIQLSPVTANGTTNVAAAVQLTHGASRTFLVGLYMPAPSGINQNFLQGLVSTFGITWHIDQ